MLAYRLVKLIESHSDRLAEGLLVELQECEKTKEFHRKLPAEEFRQRVFDLYQHLGEWLLGKQESDIARRYTEIGKRRYQQGIPFSQLLYAIVLTREHLWNYLHNEASMEKPVEVFGELEMMQLLEQFFDRALYYAALGYEQAQTAGSGRIAEAEHVLGH
jgi:hypothetical protein